MNHIIIPGRRQDGTRNPAEEHPTTPPVTAAPDCPRQNQKHLTSEARRKLFAKITAYIESPADPVGQHLEHGNVHHNLAFLQWHRGFLRGFEDWQRANAQGTSDDFVPLAFWDSADPLPEEIPHPGRNENIEPQPLPDDLRLLSGLQRLDFQQFTDKLEEHHDDAHGAIGGDMADPTVSPRDPIFWLFHAFYDHLYSNWQSGHPEGEVPPPHHAALREEGRRLMRAAAAGEAVSDASRSVKRVLSERSPNQPPASNVENEWELTGEELDFSDNGKESLGPTITDEVIRGEFGSDQTLTRNEMEDIEDVGTLIQVVNSKIS